MSRMLSVVAAAACFWSVSAQAAEKLSFGPPADWVLPVEPPAERSAATKGSGLALRLFDMQSRYEGAEARVYARTILQVDAAEALASAGNVGFAWNPELESITIHQLLIRRGGETIDVLKGGREFTILRREEGLERGMVSGQLTASLQIPDLRVGDAIDLAVTTAGANPVLDGHFEQGQILAAPFKADRLHAVFDWPAASKVQWKVGDALPKPALATAKGRKRLSIDRASFAATDIPGDAPARFIDLAAIQISSFANWGEISALFAGVYTDASAAGPAIREEAARIAAAHPDAPSRAAAALDLVQKQVRYHFDGTGLGNYRPAKADDVWQSRFGDCKGKTVLLLALLRELGIDAVPALVSATRGDGLEKSLPMPGRFDHVIVRAVIGGKTYWLDGTRSGDRKLEDIKAPPFRWALPLQTAGAELEALPSIDPVEPLFERLIEFDARDGLFVPAKAKMTAIVRGDGAVSLNGAHEVMSPADRERFLTSYWTDAFEKLKVEKTELSFDPELREARVTANGTIELSWSDFRLEASYSRMGRTLASPREPGPYEGLPLFVGGSFDRQRQIILLPNEGRDFFIEGEPVDVAIGPGRYRRTARVAGGRFEMEADTRFRQAELAIAEARADDEKADTLFGKRLFLRAPSTYARTEQDRDAIRKRVGSDDSVEAALALIGMDDEAGDYAAGLARTEAAIKKFGRTSALLLARARLNAILGNEAQSNADIDAAITLEPNDVAAMHAQLFKLRRTGRYEDALVVAERLILRVPRTPRFIIERADLRSMTNRLEEALTDYRLALELQPDDARARVGEVTILSRMGKNEEALKVIDEALVTLPTNISLHSLRGNVLAILGRSEDAKLALQKSIDVSPSGDAFVTRLAFGLSGSPDEQLGDILRLIELEPGRPIPQRALKSVIQLPGARDRILSALGAKKPPEAVLDSVRADLDAAAGDHDAVLARMAEQIKKEPKSPTLLNARCWYRATNGIELDGALDDCNASLALQRHAGTLDSRGLVHIRQGKFEAAIEDYESALIAAPGMPSALYGRGIAKIRAGQADSGKADIDAALTASRAIAETYAEWGLKP